MTAAFVLDASAAISWASPDEAAPRSIEDAVSRGGAHAPVVWLFEVHNVLRMLKRRKRLEGKDWEAATQAIRALPMQFDGAERGRVESEICELADEHGLTIYDAAYLELAQRRRLPLATLDDELRRAARKAQVELI